jgi:hypothetical protein
MLFNMVLDPKGPLGKGHFNHLGRRWALRYWIFVHRLHEGAGIMNIYGNEKWGDKILNWFKYTDWISIGLLVIAFIAMAGLAFSLSAFIVEAMKLVVIK